MLKKIVIILVSSFFLLHCSKSDAVYINNEKVDMVFPVFEDGKYGFIDTTGRMIIKPQFDHVELLREQNEETKHYLVENYIETKDGKSSHRTGVVAFNGICHSAPKYTKIEPFSNGYAAVYLEENKKWGFINEDGDEVIKPKYDEVGTMHNNRVLVRVHKKYGIIDNKGKYLVPAKFKERNFSFYNDKYIWRWENRKAYLTKISSNKEKTLPFQVVGHFREGMAAMSASGKYGFINENLEIVIKPQFDNIRDGFKDGYAIVGEKGKYGIINTKGEYVVKPKYDSIHYRTPNELIPVCIKDKVGLIDVNGTVYIKPIFDTINIEGNNVISASIGGKYGYINKKGEFIIIQKENEVIDCFYNGYARFNIDGGRPTDEMYSERTRGACMIEPSGGKWGLYDKNGKVAVKSQFDYIGNVFDGLVRVKTGGYKDREFLTSNNTFKINKENQISTTNFIQTQTISENLIEIYKNDKFGLMDGQGNVVFDSISNSPFYFRDGYSVFSIGGSWIAMHNHYNGEKKGLIDGNGKIVIQPVYDEVSIFSEGLAMVGNGLIVGGDGITYGKVGFINESEELVIPMMFSQAYDFKDGYAIVMNMQENEGKYTFKTYGVINHVGEAVIPIEYDNVIYITEKCYGVQKNDTWKVVKITPEGIEEELQSYTYISSFSEGLAVAARDGEIVNNKLQNAHYGYIDASMQFVIKNSFDDAQPFRNGVAVVGVMQGDVIKYGLIDTSGNYLCDPQFDGIGNFNNDLAEIVQVTKNGKKKCGLINKNGKIILSPKYDDIWLEHFGDSFIFNDRMRVSYKDSNDDSKSIYGYIDTTGKEIVKPRYSDAAHFSDGLAGVKIGDKYGFIDVNGKLIIQPQFDEVGLFNEGYAAVKIDGKWGFIDKTGTIKVKPQYKEVGKFINGQATVYPMSYYGFVDTNGNVVIPPIYQKAEDFFHGLAKVVIDGKDAYINTKGEVVWKQK